MEKNHSFILLLLLALAIGFSPSFIVGEIEKKRAIEIRLEDLLLLFFALFWIFKLLISKKKIEKPPLFLTIFLWVFVGFLSLLVNFILGNISFLRGFFYFLKEIEFFLIFFFVYFHLRGSQIFPLAKAWLFISLLNLFWVIISLESFFPQKEFYGPTLFAEPKAPLPSGASFLLFSLFLFNLYFFYFLELPFSNFKKSFLGSLCLLPTVGVFTSGSRASMAGLILGLFISFFLFFLKKKKIKKLLLIFLVFFFIFSILIKVSEKLPWVKERFLNYQRVLKEFSLAYPSSRISIWKKQIENFPLNSFYLLLGMGKSVYLISEESHSQYLRNLIETGILGSFAFLFLLISLLKLGFSGFKKNDKLANSLGVGLISSTLALSLIAFSAEVFILVKPSEIFWFFTALSAKAIFNKKNEKN